MPRSRSGCTIQTVSTDQNHKIVTPAVFLPGNDVDDSRSRHPAGGSEKPLACPILRAVRCGRMVDALQVEADP